MHRGLRRHRAAPPAADADDRSSPRRALVAACIGNVVEWYDFAVYGAFATVLAGTYFPSADESASLLASFAAFGAAFLVRPVGAVLFGRGGDRRGRRQVLATVIIVMSLATAGVGMLPGHASIGLLAPVVLVLLRLAQGLSVGGEASAASAFVVEYAPAQQRGRYGAWVWASFALGLAAGSGAAALLAWLLPAGMLAAWGWRLAFLVALPLGLAGLYLRLRLDETPRFRAVQRTHAVARRPVREALWGHRGRLLAGFGMVAAASLTFNTFFVFLPSQLVGTLGIPLSRALAAALLGLAVMAAAAPALGRLSDRVGRRPVLATGTLGLLALTVPSYLLVCGGGPAGLLVGYLVVGAALSCFVLPSFLSELFPTRVRSTALAITYGLASALFGGTAPFVDTLLVERTRNLVVPAWYATAMTLAAAIGLVLLKETAFQPLDGEDVASAALADR